MRQVAEAIAKELKSTGRKIKVKKPPATTPVYTDDIELVYYQLDTSVVNSNFHALEQLGIFIDPKQVYEDSKLFEDKDKKSARVVCRQKVVDRLHEVRVAAVRKAEIKKPGIEPTQEQLDSLDMRKQNIKLRDEKADLVKRIEELEKQMKKKKEAK